MCSQTNENWPCWFLATVNQKADIESAGKLKRCYTERNTALEDRMVRESWESEPQSMKRTLQHRLHCRRLCYRRSTRCACKPNLHIATPATSVSWLCREGTDPADSEDTSAAASTERTLCTLVQHMFQLQPLALKCCILHINDYTRNIEHNRQNECKWTFIFLYAVQTHVTKERKTKHNTQT